MKLFNIVLLLVLTFVLNGCQAPSLTISGIQGALNPLPENPLVVYFAEPPGTVKKAVIKSIEVLFPRISYTDENPNISTYYFSVKSYQLSSGVTRSEFFYLDADYDSQLQTYNDIVALINESSKRLTPVTSGLEPITEDYVGQSNSVTAIYAQATERDLYASFKSCTQDYIVGIYSPISGTLRPYDMVEYALDYYVTPLDNGSTRLIIDIIGDNTSGLNIAKSRDMARTLIGCLNQKYRLVQTTQG
jgi:hypothetical protein